MILFLWEVVIPVRVVPRKVLPRKEAIAQRRAKAAARQAKRRRTGPATTTPAARSDIVAADESAGDEEPGAPASHNPAARTLAPSTVESSYVSALIALYDDQKLANLHNNPHPRGKGVRALLQWLQIGWAAEQKRVFTDRALRGLNDGYSIDQMRSLSGLLLGKDGGLVGIGLVTQLRTRLDFLLCHAMMLRGESSRAAELADLSSLWLENEGENCLALMLKVTKGKTIALEAGGSNASAHYFGALRHKEAVLCPVGALAMWFVHRFDFAGEKPPNFADRSSWYLRKVIPGTLREPERQISEGTQLRWITQSFGAAGIDVSKGTHAMRKSAARIADMNDVPAEQVSVPAYEP